LVEQVLHLGLDAFYDTVVVIILSHHIEFLDGSMALDANVDLVHHGLNIVRYHAIGHAEGMATGQGEGRIRLCHRLHVAAHTHVAHRIAVRAARDDFAVGNAVDTFHHVAGGAVVWAEARAARPRG